MDALGNTVDKIDEQEHATNGKKDTDGCGYARKIVVVHIVQFQGKHEAIHDGSAGKTENKLMVLFGEQHRHQARGIVVDITVQHVHHHGIAKDGQGKDSSDNP